MVWKIIGFIVLAEAGLLLLPALVAAIYRESSVWSLIITAAICASFGGLLVLLIKPKSRTVYAREGFVICAMGWLVMSALGALPFVISGEMTSYIDAFFETCSGFSTTGASVITDLSAFSHGILFWRSFTHFIGGMGVLIFILAIIPNVADRSIHIMRAEAPGPVVGKLVPRMKDTARILYLIYIGMTVLECVMLICGGMPVFDSLIYTFGTAGTGGFGIKADSVASYSPYVQWVIAVFMTMFGINFNIYYLILARKIKAALSSAEMYVYLGIITAVTVTVAVNISDLYTNTGDIVRNAFFQTASVMTTTGYSTADFSLWPELSRGLLFVLMFIGACAGSTAGGIKVARVVILAKSAGRELRRLIHPRAVNRVKFEGKRMNDQAAAGVGNYLVLYIGCYLLVFIILCFDKLSFEENITAAASCFNNIGPAYGRLFAGYADYSGFSKIILSLAMLAGRLEIYPLLLTFMPSTWLRK